MRGELIYTSAPQGVRPGTSGFCTVGVTRGLPRREQQRLESLSGYDFLYGLSDPKAASNPTAFLHTRIDVGGTPHDVLSRVGFAGADHTGRSNKIAHHHLLDPQDRTGAGPAAALQAIGGAGRFLFTWSGAPTERDAPILGPVLAQSSTMGGAPSWAKVAGDAGWAGALVRAFKESPKSPAIVVVRPDTDVLALFAESLALLPEPERWEVCFTTYFTGSLPPDVACHWRGAVEGTPGAEQARRLAGATVLDVTRPLGAPTEDRYTEAARAGRVLSTPARVAIAEPTKTTAKPVKAIRVRGSPKEAPIELALSEHAEQRTRFGFVELQIPSVEEQPSGSRNGGWSPAWLYLGFAAALVGLAVGVLNAGGAEADASATPHRATLPSLPGPAPAQASSSPTPVARPTTEPLAAPEPSTEFAHPLVPDGATKVIPEPARTSTESSQPMAMAGTEAPVPDPSLATSTESGHPPEPTVEPRADGRLALTVDEQPPREGIAPLTTVMPLAPALASETAWVISRVAPSMTVVNRLEKYVHFEVADSGRVIELSFTRRKKLPLASIEVEQRGEELIVRRRALTKDVELLHLLSLVPIEIGQGEDWSRLLVETHPAARVIQFGCVRGRVTMDRAVPTLQLPVVIFRRPETSRNERSESIGEYPEWTRVETTGLEAKPKTSFVAKGSLWKETGEPAELKINPSGLVGEFFKKLAKRSPPKPKDIEDAYYQCRAEFNEHRIRWVDAWGVVRADMVLRWSEEQ